MDDFETRYFPNHLRAWRKYFGLTQEELALILDTDASVISQMETGKRGISKSWLDRYGEAFDVTPGIIADLDPFEMPEEIKDLLTHPGQPNSPETLRILRIYQIDKLPTNTRALPKPEPEPPSEDEDEAPDESEGGGQG